MTTQQLLITAEGAVFGLYGEEFDFGSLGTVAIRRASSIEPDERGRWLADLSPVAGPTLGPFTLRSAALAAEVLWLDLHLAVLPERLNPTERKRS